MTFSQEQVARETGAQVLIHDPPVFERKGRPRTQRITGPLEGRARGGGARGRTGNKPTIQTDPLMLLASQPPLELGSDENGMNSPETPRSPSLKRRKRVVTCTYCKEENHYKTTCKKRIADERRGQ